MKIRLATTEDAPAISRLVYSLSANYIANQFSEEGTRNLLGSMEPSAIEGYLKSGFRYHLAEDDGVLVGVVGTRDNTHLYHLFVAESHQRRGLAKELWRVAREACTVAGNLGEFTVNSSSFALPFYTKLGFVEIGSQENRRRVISIPMRWSGKEPNFSLQGTLLSSRP
jgi:GNAT superfamily N-acetyltransferase